MNRENYSVLKKIEYLTNSGEYQKAIDLLDQELTIDPQNALAWWAKGKTISMSVVGVTAGGLRITTENLPQDSISKLAWFHNALRCFDTALEINPDLDFVYESKSLLLSRMGKNNDAVECGLRAIEINPENFITLLNLALWYNDLKDFGNGLKYANKSLAKKSLLNRDQLGALYFNKAMSEFNLNNTNFRNSMTLAIQNCKNHELKRKYKDQMKQLLSYRQYRDPYE